MKTDKEAWKKEFAKRLQKSLDDNNMKPVDLHNLTGINQTDIHNYLTGEYLPKTDRIFIMAMVLNVDPTWLYAFDCGYSGLDRFRHAGKEESDQVRSARVKLRHLADTASPDGLLKMLQLSQIVLPDDQKESSPDRHPENQ